MLKFQFWAFKNVRTNIGGRGRNFSGLLPRPRGQKLKASVFENSLL